MVPIKMAVSFSIIGVNYWWGDALSVVEGLGRLALSAVEVFCSNFLVVIISIS